MLASISLRVERVEGVEERCKDVMEKEKGLLHFASHIHIASLSRRRESTQPHVLRLVPRTPRPQAAQAKERDSAVRVHNASSAHDHDQEPDRR